MVSDKKQIRVLVSTSTFPLEHLDGLPRFVCDLSKALAEQCEVSALAPGAPGAPGLETRGKLKVHRFTYLLPRRWQMLAYGSGMLQNLRRRPQLWIQVAFYFAAQILATRHLRRKLDVDVVNSHWMVPQGLSTAVVRGRRGRLTHVLTVHAADLFLLERMPWGRALARYIVDRSDAILVVSSEIQRRLDALVGRDTGSSIQPMGVDLSVFQNAPRPPHEAGFPDGFLLFVGRFTEKKGIVFLIRAMPAILRCRPDLGLVLIGSGEDEQEIRREVSRLDLESKVRFVGSQPHPVVASYLGACRAAVVPSIVDRRGEADGMPTVVVEALAAGARVVGTRVDGIPDVLSHGENGWLCRPADSEDLAKTVLLALESERSSEVVEAARRTAARLSWPEVASQYHRVFADVVRRPPPESSSREPGESGVL